MAAMKRKLHLNWDDEKKLWLVKKTFGFLAPKYSFSEQDLTEYLVANSDIEVIARYF